MRIIGHLDMDAFFAAVEERNNPRWRGLPLVVGADPRGGQGRGVVSTANYAARAFGIGSGMPITRAWRLAEAARHAGAPATIFTGGSFGSYGKVSRRIMALLKERAVNVQQRSVDEAYFDLSAAGSYEAAAVLARELKAAIVDQEQLTASIGVAPNKLVAKIASDHDKPDGLTVVPESDVLDFLALLPLRAIPGVGPKTDARLQELGLQTVAEARAVPREVLEQLFGVWGAALYDKVRGRDDTPLRDHDVAKSVGHHVTLFEDTLSPAVLLPCLREMCDEVWQRWHNDGFTTFRTVVLTVRFNNFVTVTRSRTLPTATADKAILWHESLKLFLPFLDRRENQTLRPLRLLGVRVEKLA